jgi:uncharacterized protein YkwD
MRAPATSSAARRIARFIIVSSVLTAMMAVLLAPTPASAVSSKEQQLYSMISKARSGRGLGSLQLSEELSAVARSHSKRMARENTMFHTPCLSCRIDTGSVLAENVGFGRSVRQVHRMLMRSAGHRANLLGGFNRIGVGVVKRGATYWVTQIFVA